MLGAHSGSLYRNVVAHTRDLGASGDRAPVRQQPCNISVPVLSAMQTTVNSHYCRHSCDHELLSFLARVCNSEVRDGDSLIYYPANRGFLSCRFYFQVFLWLSLPLLFYFPARKTSATIQSFFLLSMCHCCYGNQLTCNT